MKRARTSPEVPKAGALLLDRYRVETHLVTGGMGEVWRGRDSRLGSAVAIKFLLRSGEAACRRFRDEAEIAARLAGPHIVRVFDRGEFACVPFLVMEFLEGETLRKRLSIEGRLAPQTTLRIIEQVADGLSEAHRAGIIHRDIKPENIFLNGVGNTSVVKLLDFGVAKSDPGHQTNTGDLVGTPLYASPEQLADSSRLGPETDLWALAVVTFECLSGKRPFSADSLAASLDAIALGVPTGRSMDSFSESLQRWFRVAFASNRNDRPQDVASFMDGLHRALQNHHGSRDATLTTAAPQSSRNSRPSFQHRVPFRSRWGRPMWWVAGAAVAIGLALWISQFLTHAPATTSAPTPRFENPPNLASTDAFADNVASNRDAPRKPPPVHLPLGERRATDEKREGADAVARGPAKGRAPLSADTRVGDSSTTTPSRPASNVAPLRQSKTEPSDEEILWSRRK